MDNSCQPGALTTCAFSSPEINVTSAQARFQSGSDLPISLSAPVGAFYAWRVRACDGAARCSSYSAPAYLHVGRTPQDLNGDGFADALVRSGVIQAGAELVEVYFGGASFNPQVDLRISLPTGAYSLRHVGDINGDGFGDLALIANTFQVCGSDGGYPQILFGGTDVAALPVQNLCTAAGSPSVTFQLGLTGDVDGDGFADLGLTREFSNSRFVILRGGVAVVGVPEVDIDITLEGAVGTYPHVIGDRTFDGAGDFNRDGYADVFVSGRGIAPAFLRTRLFLGARALPRSMAGSFDFSVESPEANSPLVTRIGDLNQDGREDWAFGIGVGGTVGGRVALLMGAAAAPTQFSRVVQLSAPLVSLSRSIDFDRDGQGEVFVAPSAALLLLRNTGGLVETPTGSLLNASARLGSADHNGDGREDLLLQSTGSGNSSVRWVAAAASFTVTPISLLPFDAVSSSAVRNIVY